MTDDELWYLLQILFLRWDALIGPRSRSRPLTFHAVRFKRWPRVAWACQMLSLVDSTSAQSSFPRASLKLPGRTQIREPGEPGLGSCFLMTPNIAEHASEPLDLPNHIRPQQIISNQVLMLDRLAWQVVCLQIVQFESAIAFSLTQPLKPVQSVGARCSFPGGLAQNILVYLMNLVTPSLYEH